MTRLRSCSLAAMLVALAAASTTPSPAAADDGGLSWSGFATLGYARSDRDFRWQRHIRDEGGFDRDSLVGGQLDWRIGPHWSATAQVRARPSTYEDGHWKVEPTWAFLAWRPDDDWLLRAGKLRVPLYLYSETQDIGAASEMLRLPAEQYWIAPTSDMTGLYATRMWTLGEQELSVDAYAGSARTEYVGWSANGLPPQVAPGQIRTRVDVRASGLVLTARSPSTLWRLGLHHSTTRQRDGRRFAVRYPRVELAPGIGYWQVDEALDGPGIETVPRIRNRTLTAGFEWSIGDGWKLASEGTLIRQRDIELGSNAKAGYVALFKSVDRLTVYGSVARLLSGDRERRWSEQLTGQLMPAGVPGADQVNAVQGFVGETIPAFDQHTWALGTSWALTPSSRLKAEFARTHIGSMSTMAWHGPGETRPRDTRVDVLSFSYAIAF